MADGKVKIDVTVDDSDAKKKLDGIEDKAEDAGKGLEDLGDSAGKGGKGLGLLDIAAGNLVAGGISSLISGLGDAVQSLVNLADETREFREDMAKLETAFKDAGHSTEAASKVYEDFYAILGESDRSVEAVNHLAELTDNTEDLSKWSTIAAGVTAKFGDSLPIEGLTEAANETAKVGAVTGPLADALNWAGISEEKFNEQLKKCNSEQERATLITNTLNKEYSAAAAEYNMLTASTQEARRATAEYEQKQAELGALIEPFATKLTEAKTALLGFAVEAMTAKKSADVLTESQRESVTVAHEAAEAYREQKRAVHEAALAQIADVDYATNFLLPQLQEIVDANGRVREGYQERAEFILGQMNEAWGTEYTRISEIIGKNGELKQSVLDVIEAKKAQILLAAHEEDYKRAIEESAAAEAAWVQQAQAKAKAYEDVKAAEEELTRVMEEEKDERGLLAGVDTAAAQANLAEKKRVLKEQTEAYDKAEEDVLGYYSDINAYQHASTLIMEGKTSEAISYLNDLSLGYEKTTGKVQNSVEEQMAILEQQAIDTGVKAVMMREAYTKGVAGVTEEMVKTAEKAAEKAKTEFEKIGGQIGDGIGKGAEDKKPGLLTKIRNIVSAMKAAAEDEADINSPSREFAWIGEMIVLGLAKGIDEKREKAIHAMQKLGEDTIAVMQKTAKEEVAGLEKKIKDLEKTRNKGNSEAIAAQRETLQEELNIAKERERALSSYANVYERTMNELVKIEEGYVRDVASVHETLANDIDKAWEDYETALANRVSSIKSSLNLFEEAQKGDRVFAGTLKKNLRSQIEVLEDYNAALDTLATRNVSTAFIEEIKGFGIDALPEIEAIGNMSDEQLTEYVALWEEKGRLAKEAALDELSAMHDDTIAQVEQLKLDADTKLEELNAGYRDSMMALMQEIGEGMSEAGDAGLRELGNKITLFVQMGEYLMDGVADGMANEQDRIVQEAVNNVYAAIEAAKAAAGIHSPSTIMRDQVGKNLGLGLAVGWKKQVDAIKKTMATDVSGITANVRATVSAENARFSNNTGVPDTGFTDLARAVGMQTAGINSLAGEYRRGSGNVRPIIIQLDKRELGRAFVDVGGTEETRIGAKISYGGAR